MHPTSFDPLPKVHHLRHSHQKDQAMLTIHVKRLNEQAIIATKAHATDAGWDLYCVRHTFIDSEPTRVSTGISLAIPEGYYGQIQGRSGLASKGVDVFPGVIDSGYRGPIEVVMSFVSTDDEPGDDDGDYEIKAGSKIAQLVILPVPQTQMVDVGTRDLPNGERGANGFGSSDRQDEFYPGPQDPEFWEQGKTPKPPEKPQDAPGQSHGDQGGESTIGTRAESQRDFWKAEANRLAESLTEVKKELGQVRKNESFLYNELAQVRANPPATQTMVPKKVHDELKKLNDQLQEKVSQASIYIEGWRLQKIATQELRDELARVRIRLGNEQAETGKALNEVNRLKHQIDESRKTHFRAILDELVKVVEVIKPRYLEPAQWDVINTAFDALGKPSPFFQGNMVAKKL